MTDQNQTELAADLGREGLTTRTGNFFFLNDKKKVVIDFFAQNRSTQVVKEKATCVDPSTLMNNQDKNSPNNMKTISSRRVVKITKNFNKGIFS